MSERCTYVRATERGKSRSLHLLTHIKHTNIKINNVPARAEMRSASLACGQRRGGDGGRSGARSSKRMTVFVWVGWEVEGKKGVKSLRKQLCWVVFF